MTPYPLHKSDRNTKVLITLFLATMLVSIAVAELNVWDKVRWTPAGIVQRYGADAPPPASTAVAPAAPAPAPASGQDDFPMESGANAADVPAAGRPSTSEVQPAASPDAEALVARMNTFSLLVDVTHPHIFELPVVLFVLAHFLMRTRTAGWFKLANYVVAFGGIALFLATPWLVRYVTERAASLLLVGAVAVGTTSLVMIFVSVVDMWMPARRAGRRVPDVLAQTASVAGD